MKKISILIFIITFFSTLAFAQKPQLILGIAKEEKSIDYYDQQFDLWTKEAKKDPSNGLAWRQRYLAKRAFLQKQSLQTWLNQPQIVFSKLDKVIEESKTHIGESFEYYFMKAMNSKGKKAIDYSLKAHKIDPDRDEVYGWIFGFSVIDGDDTLASDMGKRMMKSNAYSNANLLWNLNGLQTAEPNSIFIANGDLDCGPKWLLQYANNIRRDVLVISKWSLDQDDAYRSRIFKEVGIPQPDKTRNDFSAPVEYIDYLTVTLLKNGKRNAYMQCGTDINLFKRYDIENKMYLVGNAFVYSDRRFDNYKVLRDNLKKYRLEYLLDDFQSHPELSLIKTDIHLTYLPALNSAIKYYADNGQDEMESYYADVMNVILEESGREKELRELYKNN